MSDVWKVEDLAPEMKSQQSISGAQLNFQYAW